MSNAKRVVLLAVIALFGVWLVVHWDRVNGDEDALIRFTLGVLFAVLVILRRKNPDHFLRIPDWTLPLSLVGGMFAALGGIIFSIHMLEWSGVLLLLFACCFWISALRQRSDLLLAFFVLFWVHPLPGQIFGWLQGGMQRLSVLGSELVLHIFNVRVWGDGTVLRTGYQNFLVPDACSGMRTSVTVFLCALGVGLLLRLRWYETLFFVVLGLVQVLTLNIARISYMVLWAPQMPPEWAENFLHDTLGVFLLGAIVLVNVEAGWWMWWSRRRAYIRAGIRSRELEGPDKASIVPHSLRQLGMVMTVLIGVGLIGFGVFVMVYKSRAFHEKEMVLGVAEGLMETDPASAYRAFQEIRRNFPEDTDLLAKQANTDFILGRFEGGLRLLDQIEALGGTLGLREVVMKGWALTRVDRLADARALINSLPPENDRIPGVAMLKAEFAAMEGIPADVSKYVIIASGSQSMLPRIRALFPFLARHEQWQAIALSDLDQPYAELYQALIALHANQQVNNLSGLMRVMGQAIKSWPDDPRFLSALFEVASRRRGAEWDIRFEQNLSANLSRLSADPLSAAWGYCWRLVRPDLAWKAHQYFERVSPSDPELIMAPARYGRGWTTVRRHQISVQADSADSTIDLGPVLKLFSNIRPIRDFRRRIPLINEVAMAGERSVANRYFEKGLADLQRREAEGPLGERFLRLYPMVLAMLNRFDEAHQRLDHIAEVYPERKADVFFQHAALYDQQTEWQKSYEMLREYMALRPTPDLTTKLLTINSLMNLNLGVCAMQVLTESRGSFPGAVRLDMAESAIWDVFGFKAQALHVMEKSSLGVNTPVAVGLLYATGRQTEAQRLSAVLRMSGGDAAKIDPPLQLPPAVWVLTPRWPPPPDAAELDEQITKVKGECERAFSPFIRSLRGLTLGWVESLKSGPYSVADAAATDAAVARWEAVGRSPLESLGALYEVAMLAARQQDAGLAKAALRRALVLFPGNAVVWRALVALSGDDADTVQLASASCPQDPDLFLAALVMTVNQSKDDARWEVVSQQVDGMIASDVFSPETLVRAGDFLLGQGKPDLAAKLARAAVPKAHGLLAAYVLALRTALIQGDVDWAQASTIHGIEQALDPIPFYRVLVNIKVARRQVDNDLLSALEYLKTNQQEDPRWAEALGALYFQKGDMRRALTIFGSVIDEDIKGVQVQTLLLAAEAARLDSKTDRAIRILEAAYTMQPEQVGVLNNLIYLLAQNPNTLSRAQSLLPKLLAMGSDSFAVMDTAAMVALRSGDTATAEDMMEKALSLLQEGGYAVQEVKLNAAEVKIRSGDVEAAREALKRLRRDPVRSDNVDQRARQLLSEIDLLGKK